MTAVLAGGPMSVATVYRCVKLISESVATLPILWQDRRGEVFVDSSDRMAYLLNVSPSPEVSAFDFWCRVVQEVLFAGNAYIVPVCSPISPEVERLVLCTRGTVEYNYLSDIYRVYDLLNGIEGTFGHEDMIHIKGLTGVNPKIGVGVIANARLALAIAQAGDKETRTRFESGGTVKGIVTNPKAGTTGFNEYADDELEKLAQQIDRGWHIDRYNIVGIPGAANFQQTSMSSADLQFLESRKFTVQEICRFFSVHPTYAFADTSNNYKSVEQSQLMFLNTTLNPILVSIERELQRKLISPALYGRKRVMFDRRGLFACEPEARARYQAQAIANGTFTINDCRRMENMPPVANGDTLLVTANLKTIEQLKNETNHNNE